MNPKDYLGNISSDSVDIKLSGSDAESNIFLYPTRLGFLATRPPYAFEQAAAEGYLIVFTVSGTGMLRWDDVDYFLDEGSIAFIPQHSCYHLCAATHDRHWRFLFINFNGKYAHEYYSYIMNNKEPVLVPESRDTVIALMWRMINRYNAEQAEAFAELSTFSNILDILSTIAMIDAPAPYYNRTMPDYLKSLYYYLDSHYMEKITLDSLEKQYSTSKYYIARQFKEYSGITINEYIAKKRLQRAKFMLQHTELPIGEIAEMVGFYDARHFIRRFKAVEHVTPSAYRKAVRG